MSLATGRDSGRSSFAQSSSYQGTRKSSEASALNAQTLAQFTGSQEFYRHILSGGCLYLSGGCLYTEGVQFVAEVGEAYWLIDAILCPQPHFDVLRKAEFQVWTLTVGENTSATLTCTDGDDGTLYVHEIAWTDFPLDSISFCFSDKTLYLPSEH